MNFKILTTWKLRSFAQNLKRNFSIKSYIL
jgi:hypothetical protein